MKTECVAKDCTNSLDPKDFESNGNFCKDCCAKAGRMAGGKGAEARYNANLTMLGGDVV